LTALFSNLPTEIFTSKSLHIQKAKNQKPKAQSSKDKKSKAKSPASSFSESFIANGKQGGAVVLGEGRDIVTRETCVPASLNINNLGEAAVLHFPLLWLGLFLNILGKATELHLALLMSSSHRLLIISSP
jgi:hypothetical protein